MEIIRFHAREILNFVSQDAMSLTDIPFFSFWTAGISSLIGIFFLIGLALLFSERPKAFSHITLTIGAIGLFVYLGNIFLNSSLPITMNKALTIDLFSALSIGLFGSLCSLILAFLEKFFLETNSNQTLEKYQKELVTLLKKQRQQLGNKLSYEDLNQLNSLIVHISQQIQTLTEVVNDNSLKINQQPHSSTRPEYNIHENQQPKTSALHDLNENPTSSATGIVDFPNKNFMPKK